MKKIIFATGNEHKMVEVRMILDGLGLEILSQKEAEIQADVVEDGTTFEENALIKASEIAKIAHEMPEYKEAVVMADDSGLEIDYLNKEPGIYSARYMGEDTSYDIKNQALLDRLDGVPDKNVQRGLSVRSQLYFRMEAMKLCAARWRALLVMRLPEKTDLDMIRFSICRNVDVPAQNLRRKRRTDEATEEKDFGKCVRFWRIKRNENTDRK